MTIKYTSCEKLGKQRREFIYYTSEKPFVELDGNGFFFGEITKQPTKMDSSKKLQRNKSDVIK